MPETADTQTTEQPQNLLAAAHEQPQAAEQEQEQAIPSNTGAPQAAEQTAREISAPEGLDAPELWDREKGQLDAAKTIEELNRRGKMAKDLRQKLSRGGAVPQNPEDYHIKPEGEGAAFINPDSETMPEIKKIAHGCGMTEAQLNSFMNGFMAMAAKRGDLKAPPTPEEQKAAIEAEKAKLGANAEEQITAARQFIESQYRQGIFSEEDKAWLMEHGNSAQGIRIICKLRQLAGAPAIPAGTANIAGLESDSEILEHWDKYSDSEKIKILEARHKAGRPNRFLEDY